MIIRDKIYIPLEKLGRWSSDLVKLFVYQNPEYFSKSRMGFSVNKCSPFVANYAMQDINGHKYIVVPRGGLYKVKKFFESKNLVFKFVDETIKYPPILDVELINTELEPQQHLIIQTLLENNGGLIQAEPGAGKTISILGLITQLKQPTLILVHEHRLRSQWEDEISFRLKGNFVFGRYDGDVKEDGDIVIGLINTVYNLRSMGDDVFKKFSVVVIDECHRLPAHMYTTVLNHIPAHYRIGVTGTVKRKDNKEFLLHDLLGPTLITIDAKDLKHRIMSFTYTMIDTDISFEAPKRMVWADGRRLPKLDYVKLLTLLTSNEKRNLFILDNIIKSIEKGHLPLVLSDRVNHCKYFHQKLQDLGFKSILLIGETRKKTQWERIRKDDTIQVIVAQSSIASEGLDYPKLSALHLVCPTTNQPKLKQKIGRIRRNVENKILPEVYDYVDNLVQFKDEKGHLFFPLKRSAKLRERLYRELQQEYH